MLGRDWRSHDVVWAGNPTTPKKKINGILHPRNSFETFLEKAKMESYAWTPADQTVIKIFRDRICTEQSQGWMLALLREDIEEANRRYVNAIQTTENNNDFFAHMAHELRTPFHASLACLNILHDSIDEMDPAEVKEMIKTAISSGNHMINLLNDILNRSKNKYLSTLTVRENIIYQTVASEIVEGMRSLAMNMELKFEVAVEPKGSDCIIIDRTKLTQIITNLVNNAIKFTAGEGSRVRTSFELVAKMEGAIKGWEKASQEYSGTVFMRRDGMKLESVESVQSLVKSLPTRPRHKWLAVTIEDDGIGMSKEDLAKMFQPYTQASQSGARKFEGTGLGLFFSMSLCQDFNGFLACSSTAGKGTVFHVGLPVEDGDPKAVQDKPTEDSLASEIPLCGPILIADDNSINLRVLEKQLSIHLKRVGIGAELIQVDGGKTALEMYKQRLPALCIIDYHMPGMDGRETTERIRKYEIEQNLPASYIISYTADTTDKAANLLLESGANEIMAKPPPSNFIATLVGRLRVGTSTKILTHSCSIKI